MDSAIDDHAPARPPVRSFVVPDDEPPAPRLAARLLAPPRWRFHLLCVLGAAGVAWAASSPMSATVPQGRFAWLGAACAAIWALRALVAAGRRRLALGYLVVPALAVALGALIYLDAPQQARWFQAADGFEQTLRALPVEKEWDQAAADAMLPERVGSYVLKGVTRGEEGNVQFRVDGGAAFTYLVEGVTDEIRAANPGAEFEHVNGNWYIIRPAD